MKTRLLPIFFAALVMASPAWAQTTQTEIQADLLGTQIIAELKAKNYAKADALFREYDALGVDMPPPLQLQRALTHFHLKKYWEAEKLLLVYLQRAQRGSDEYRQALSMLAEVKPLAAPARAEAERKAAQARAAEQARQEKEAVCEGARGSWWPDGDFPYVHKLAKANRCLKLLGEILNGLDVNHRDQAGYTLLHDAAFFGSYEVASMLISNLANVNARSPSGRTPLHRAAYGKELEVAALLIQFGADVNAKDNKGWTPLRVAKGRAMKKLLREHGATK